MSKGPNVLKELATEAQSTEEFRIWEMSERLAEGGGYPPVFA